MTLFASLPAALVSSDGFYQVVGPSVMEEEGTLSYAPEGCCPELVGTCAALRDAVGETFAHVVDEKVGEKIHRLIGKCCARHGRGAARNHLARGKRGCVAVDAAYPCKSSTSLLGWRVWREQGWAGPASA